MINDVEILKIAIKDAQAEYADTFYEGKRLMLIRAIARLKERIDRICKFGEDF